jgi:hypothetical protein
MLWKNHTNKLIVDANRVNALQLFFSFRFELQVVTALEGTVPALASLLAALV